MVKVLIARWAVGPNLCRRQRRRRQADRNERRTGALPRHPPSTTASPAKLPPGLYEQLVTQGVERRLRLIPGLVVRETKEADEDLGAPPYLYAGPMKYVSHTGERPMRILWHLEHELPADIFHAARVAIG